MNKRAIFQKELSYIVDEDIRESLAIMIDKIPDYFFTIAAASTGKYHPSYAQNTGGLVRHTKAAVRIAYELFNIYKFKQRTKDLIIMALVLHDSVKKGENESTYTLFDHPLLACEFLRKNQSELLINKDDIDFVCSCISTHMGKFNTSNYSDTILPLPTSPEQKFVHMCDFLASRKVINIIFDDNNNIVDE